MLQVAIASGGLVGRDGILRGAAQKKKGQKKGRHAVWSNVIYLSLCYVLSMFLCCVMSRSPTVRVKERMCDDVRRSFTYYSL